MSRTRASSAPVTNSQSRLARVPQVAEEPEEEPLSTLRRQRLPIHISPRALTEGSLSSPYDGAVYVVWRLGDCIVDRDFAGIHWGAGCWAGIINLTREGRYRCQVHRLRRVHPDHPTLVVFLDSLLWCAVRVYEAEYRRHRCRRQARLWQWL
eukprot:1615956-Amphidinium_carterae.1